MQDRLIKFENFDDYWTETSDVIDEEVALGGTFVSSVEKHIVEKAIMYKLANAVIYGPTIHNQK